MKLEESILTNPFRQKNEPYRVFFAAAHSATVKTSEWQAFRQRFWVLDLAGDPSMRVDVRGKIMARPLHSVALYAPGVLYKEIFEKDGVISKAWLMFRATDRQSPLRKLVGRQGFCILEDRAALVRPLVSQIAACFQKPTPASEWLAQSNFYKILSLMQSANGKFIRSILSPQLHSTRENKSLKGRVERLLFAHLDLRLTAARAASQLGLGLSAFTHRYRLEAGETFVQTRTRIRIQQAKSLLLAENLPIKALARDLGFSDSAHFSRVFLRQVGMTPAHFRAELGHRFNDRTKAVSIRT